MTVAAIVLAIFSACGRLPGQPSPSARPERPSQVTNFDQLYSANCAGCHGADGHFGGALPLNNPAYLALVDDASMLNAIANGITGTSMPAFAVSSGGMLTNEQINAIVRGIRSRWGTEVRPIEGTPPYVSSQVGDVAQGGELFKRHCASCHGADGTAGTAGAITNPSFLALYNDQTLRTLIIAGRPDLGHPGWRDYKPALDSAQVSDIVAWLAVKRGS
jgi:cytochrome c oxidase cbb3-type subunit 3/ubiquinol-cytochrome c reductase cytochrome c subunit